MLQIANRFLLCCVDVAVFIYKLMYKFDPVDIDVMMM